ncbi:NAD(P)-dependent alcohol dehydrogenase [Oricola thermophila]|uniref:NAD(P)-dependent alcohol dehydrogenase n=1 Tax=Oricola thermophila TaxID=2742145 RepID=A0A6N1VIZ1_9HYPH|nr:NAD(P)-dependent alcohol dehydrogenase [Oricola thermophila]QKV19705.1 NAD(P)-dependent alcohol dehydrogenase [Oricola thermophila]
MKAAIHEKYGDAGVLEIRDIARPEPADGEILVKVCAAAVTTADWRLRAAAFPGIMALPGRLMFGLFAPRQKVLGTAFSGRVVARGGDVDRFALGDAVFGFSGAGAHAEYVAVKADGPVVAKPANIGHDEAAAAPFGGLAALVFLRDFAGVKPGEKVLVAGASGGVGSWAVQVAKHLGAEVVGVASTGNVDLVRSLGADRVIDYRKDDPAASGERYDVVLDTAGKLPFARARRILARTGRYLPLEFGGREMLQALWAGVTGGPKIVINVSGDSRADLEILAGLLETGEIRAVVDSRFPLRDIAAAHRRVESRHAGGAVIVLMDEAAACAPSP